MNETTFQGLLQSGKADLDIHGAIQKAARFAFKPVQRRRAQEAELETANTTGASKVDGAEADVAELQKRVAASQSKLPAEKHKSAKEDNVPKSHSSYVGQAISLWLVTLVGYALAVERRASF